MPRACARRLVLALTARARPRARGRAMTLYYVKGGGGNKERPEIVQWDSTEQRPERQRALQGIDVFGTSL